MSKDIKDTTLRQTLNISMIANEKLLQKKHKTN